LTEQKHFLMCEHQFVLAVDADRIRPELASQSPRRSVVSRRGGSPMPDEPVRIRRLNASAGASHAELKPASVTRRRLALDGERRACVIGAMRAILAKVIAMDSVQF
jgi:hypothetical protein